MAETKVLYESPDAPSGAANALFKILEDERALEKRKDFATFETGLKMKEQEQAHNFGKELERMRHDFTLLRDAEARRMQEMFAARQGSAIIGAAQSMGGLPQRSPEDGVEPSFDPLAGTFLGNMAQENLRQTADYSQKVGLAQLQHEQQLALENAKNPYVTQSDLTRGHTLASTLRRLNPDSVFASLLEGVTPGTMRLAEYNKMLDTAASKVEEHTARRIIAKGRDDARLKIAGDVNATRLAVAGLLAKGKLSTQETTQLRTAANALNQRISHAMQEVSLAEQEASNPLASAAERTLAAQRAGHWRGVVESANRAHLEITNKLLAQTNTTEANPPSVTEMQGLILNEILRDDPRFKNLRKQYTKDGVLNWSKVPKETLQALNNEVTKRLRSRMPK